MNPIGTLGQAMLAQQDTREVTAHVTQAIDARLEPGTWKLRELIKGLRLVRDPGYPDPANLAGVWKLDGTKLIEVTPRESHRHPISGHLVTRRGYKSF
jgi:hypothetical protein